MLLNELFVLQLQIPHPIEHIQPVTEVLLFLTLKLLIEKAVSIDEVPFDVLYGDLHGSSASNVLGPEIWSGKG